MRWAGTVLAVVVVIGAPGALASPPVQTAKPSQVVWFSGKTSHGMRQDSAGNLFAARRKLAVAERLGRLFAAAYYPRSDVLVTVDGQAVARLYERGGKLLKLKQTGPAHEFKGQHLVGGPIHSESVRFCRIPGLVYLTWSHPEPSTPVQVSTQLSERLALGARARNWHAVTAEYPNVSFLGYTYQIASPNSLRLYGPDGKSIVLRLPGQLAEAMGTLPAPYVRLEPVFVLQGRAIICKTRNGWSLHNLKGALVSYFPCGRLGNWGWHEPLYRNGHYYAVQTSKGAWYYRMDVPTGKLVYVGENIPQ